MSTSVKSVLTTSASALITVTLAASLSAGPAAADSSPTVLAPTTVAVPSTGIPVSDDGGQKTIIDTIWCRIFLCRR